MPDALHVSCQIKVQGGRQNAAWSRDAGRLFPLLRGRVPAFLRQQADQILEGSVGRLGRQIPLEYPETGFRVRGLPFICLVVGKLVRELVGEGAANPGVEVEAEVPGQIFSLRDFGDARLRARQYDIAAKCGMIAALGYDERFQIRAGAQQSVGGQHRIVDIRRQAGRRHGAARVGVHHQIIEIVQRRKAAVGVCASYRGRNDGDSCRRRVGFQRGIERLRIEARTFRETFALVIGARREEIDFVRPLDHVDQIAILFQEAQGLCRLDARSENQRRLDA